MLTSLRHWLTPHHTNNYRARLLHNFGISLLIILAVAFHFLLIFLENSPLHILGFQSSITPEEVVKQTNIQRLALGLPELKISTQLNQAAQAKADYMFQHNFWAHVAPDGTTPWQFISQAGYDYLYAGENLAKGFRDTQHMIQAWMNSPTHKANIVSPKYQEIGVAVVPGRLQGKETVLVVQMFGARKSPQQTNAPPEITSASTATAAAVAQNPLIAQIKGSTPQPSPTSTPLLDEFTLSKTISLVLVSLMMLTLILDLVVAESKNLSRRVGKNWAHLIFINLILIALSVIHAGNIL